MNLELISPFAAVSFNQAVGSFLDFAQTLCLIFAVAKVAQGGWNISRGDVSDGYANIGAGFLIGAAVLIVRMFAAWLGITL